MAGVLRHFTLLKSMAQTNHKFPATFVLIKKQVLSTDNAALWCLQPEAVYARTQSERERGKGGLGERERDCFHVLKRLPRL